MMQTFLWLLIWMPAGFALFVFTYGRFILHLRNTRLKFALIVLTFFGFAGLALAMALRTGGSAWLWLPGCILLLGLAFEAQRLAIRRRCRGSAPVETRNTQLHWLRPVTTLDLALRRYEVHPDGWRGGRLRVAHISDLHVHAGLPMSHYQAALRQAADVEPDLLFITGDFLTQRQSLDLLPAALAGATARLGVYGVLGNHDVWEGGPEVADVIRAAGVRLLGNGWERIEHASGVIVSGCEEPWAEGPWEPPPPDAGPALVLTHTADNIYRLLSARPLAVFAGHYHGGQAVVPVWGPIIVPSRLGRRFTHGHFCVDGTHLFVTTGIGAAFPPVRVYCKPDILVVDFM